MGTSASKDCSYYFILSVSPCTVVILNSLPTVGTLLGAVPRKGHCSPYESMSSIVKGKCTLFAKKNH